MTAAAKLALVVLIPVLVALLQQPAYHALPPVH